MTEETVNFPLASGRHLLTAWEKQKKGKTHREEGSSIDGDGGRKQLVRFCSAVFAESGGSW